MRFVSYFTLLLCHGALLLLYFSCCNLVVTHVHQSCIFVSWYTYNALLTSKNIMMVLFLFTTYGSLQLEYMNEE